MIVAVTGANGFIGSHACDAFRAAGDDVRPIVRENLRSGRELDSLLRDADAVVHAAGATRAVRAADFHASNVELTQHVAGAAHRAGVRRIVFISSQAAAGPAASLDAPITERDAPRPIEDYGRSKLAAESVVRESGMSYAILRPAAVYGSRDRDFLAMFRLANAGLAIHPGNRDHWLSIIHVRDVVSAIVAAARSNVVGGTYFLANHEPVQWRDLFMCAAEACGRRLRLDIEAPMGLARLAALAGDGVGLLTGRPALLSSGKLALSTPRFWVCSAAAARSALGLRESATIAEGFRETCEWYRHAHWLPG